MTISKDLKKLAPRGTQAVKDTQKTTEGLSARTSRQNALRQRLERSADDIIDKMVNVILTGNLEGDKVANGMRLDLMKAYMPYVLPTLKSIEYIDQRPKDLQPLVINMNGGAAQINTDDNTITLDANAKENLTDVRKEYIEADLGHASKFNNVISHDTKLGEDNGNLEVPQVFMKQASPEEAVVFEHEGDLQEILRKATDLQEQRKKKANK